MNTPSDSPLGKTIASPNAYSPDVLFPILRQRDTLMADEKLPFQGFDAWTVYELSWLNQKGKPIIAMANITLPCESPFLIESKSLKLYFNSFHQSVFEEMHQIKSTIEHDLSEKAGAPVHVHLFEESEVIQHGLTTLNGICLDSLDVCCNTYDPNPAVLHCHDQARSETLYSHLFRSLCPVTSQPDWASVSIQYSGKHIDHNALLQYLVSYRNHKDFHEHCVEKIFLDIQQQCQPSALTVFARFTRRGGLDINPYRSSEALKQITPGRLFRQ